MGRDMLKFAVFAGLIVFAVMYGMELANSGINTVYGPVDRSGAASTRSPQASSPPRQTADGGRSDGRYADEPPGLAVDGATDAADGGTAVGPDGYAIPRNDHEPAVDRLAGKTAEALQSLSKGGIRFIVSLFDKVAG
ncbi:hypothetical protein [Cohnella sp. REN36]|uniref:hypothetical protein n=1 Tax=Cohnella sp. REN36 TaxID=2887347 RepID=UPI001D15A27E|nr:hypothetical protein [Cohnella sp. REN36]MCC3375675.1 hypothetical protein [Cohnella sp. REN36]